MKVKLGNIRIFSRKVTFDTPMWGLVRLFALGLAITLLMLLSFVLYQQSWLGGLGLRYLVLPWLAVIWVLSRSAMFIQSAYELEALGSAWNYLLAVFFGLGHPRLVVRDGEKQVKAGQDNLLDKIGGPGYLFVQPGNVILIENLTGSPKALGPGRHLILRTEVIQDVISLEERNALVEKMSAVTKDGIPIEVREVRYRYRLLRSDEADGQRVHAPDDLHAFSEEAALRMAYNRTILTTGEPDWHDGVNRVFDTLITDYIAEHFVDHLTAPSARSSDLPGDVVEQPPAEEEQNRDPRSEIYVELRSESVRKKLQDLGAELLWIDIGHFDIPEKLIAEQRLSTWQSKWAGDVSELRAGGEALRLTYQELGRAEAQSEMLTSIVRALEDVGSQGDEQGEPRQHMRKVVLARIARLLDAMRDQVRTSNQEGWE